MILQALTEYYGTLLRRGKLAAPGWSPVKVGVALYLNDDGGVEQAVSVKTEQQRGKKTVMAPQTMAVPAQFKRAAGILANFLCDHSGYFLGFDDKSKPERAKECFEACKARHLAVLEGVSSPAAMAVKRFFLSWQPEKARESPALGDCMEALLGGENIVFRYGGAYVHEDPAVRDAWQSYYSDDGAAQEEVCLVTGKKCAVERLHPAIKGIRGAQSSGAALVSFNAPAFCSYTKEQSYNAPTGKYAAFAYAAALNYLIADSEHTRYVGDTAILFWAKDGEEGYRDFLTFSLFEDSDAYTSEDLRSMTAALCRGDRIDFNGSRLDPGMDFYVLGISPNAARLSVRFFMHNTFGGMLENIRAHHMRMEIARPAFDKKETLPLWYVLNETVNQKARDKSPKPGLAGEMLRAVLMDERYPATLLNGVTVRIRAEHTIGRGRAAIIKAYYLKNTHPDVPKEVLTVSLNSESTNVSYTLGRLFSMLESIQESANPGINTTIRDRYFSSASATPGRVFPTLVNLAQKHLKKLNDGLRITYQKQITELFGKLDEEYPKQMNLAQQGAFQLGYYHQTQARYTKKEEK